MKRIFDIVVSMIAILLLWPVMLITALLVRVFLGSPVLFTQYRPGLHGRLFKLVKFRSMRAVPVEDTANDASGDARRLTRFGRILRSSSLDELPELFNVLRGDMSLVGPRPLLKEYLQRYSEQQLRRHHVRPGITGLAQVSGRNNLSWDERFELDVWYVDNQSLWLDVKIIARTLLTVMARKDVNQKGRATMDPFEGTTTTIDRK